MNGVILCLPLNSCPPTGVHHLDYLPHSVIRILLWHLNLESTFRIGSIVCYDIAYLLMNTIFFHYFFKGTINLLSSVSSCKTPAVQQVGLKCIGIDLQHTWAVTPRKERSLRSDRRSAVNDTDDWVSSFSRIVCLTFFTSTGICYFKIVLPDYWCVLIVHNLKKVSKITSKG